MIVGVRIIVGDDEGQVSVSSTAMKMLERKHCKERKLFSPFTSHVWSRVKTKSNCVGEQEQNCCACPPVAAASSAQANM